MFAIETVKIFGDHDVYIRSSWKEAWKAFADATFDNSVVWARAESPMVQSSLRLIG
jgi:hypothetical protein